MTKPPKWYAEVKLIKRSLLVPDLIFRFSSGTPVFGTGAGLRLLGSDPNFMEDLREIYNVSVPVPENDEDVEIRNPNYSGNGRNKWPDPTLVSPNWRKNVIIFVNLILT